MTHIDERILELLILSPNGLDEGQRREAREHVSSCPACSEVLEYLKGFHDDLKAAPPIVSERRDSFLRSQFDSAPIIQLRPFRVDPPSAKGDHITVLAAKGNETEQRFSTIATLASDKNNTVVRLMYDRAEELFRLYVVTDDPAKKAYAIISLPELSVDLVTDVNGTVSFKLQPQKPLPAWPSLEGVLLTTVGEAIISGQQLANHPPHKPMIVNVAPATTLELSHADGTIYFEVKTPHTPPIQRLLVKTRTDQGILVKLNGNLGECVLGSLPEQFTIRLYC